jgi:hypothetical protein
MFLFELRLIIAAARIMEIKKHTGQVFPSAGKNTPPKRHL